jgi:hypothetical protein
VSSFRLAASRCWLAGAASNREEPAVEGESVGGDPITPGSSRTDGRSFYRSTAAANIKKAEAERLAQEVARSR